MFKNGYGNKINGVVSVIISFKDCLRKAVKERYFLGGLQFPGSITSLDKLWFPYFLKAQPIPCIKQLKILEYSIWLRYDPKLKTRLGNEKLRKTCLKLGKVFMQDCSYLHKNNIKHYLKFLLDFDIFWQGRKMVDSSWEAKKWETLKKWFLGVWSSIAQNSNFQVKIPGHLTF